jgi:beta-glucanase (GH16 family)
MKSMQNLKQLNKLLWSYRGVLIVVLLSLALVLNQSCTSSKVHNKPYTAAEIFTKEQYLFGKIIIKYQAAKANGIISNFFTFRTDGQKKNEYWQEIDIEVFGKDTPNTWQTNLIYGQDKRFFSEEYHQNKGLRDNINTYEIIWTPDFISWKLNGVNIRKVGPDQSSHFNRPTSFRFNIWAPDNTQWVGSVNKAQLPAWMIIDSIEYYSYKKGAFNLEWHDDFSFFNNERWGVATYSFSNNLAVFRPENVAIIEDQLHLIIDVNRNR